MNCKRLYISDLDGTLLRPDETLSPYTAKVINRLVDSGAAFSYATARSFVTASALTSTIKAEMPVIVYNGTFVIDNLTQRRLISNYFSSEDVDFIFSVLAQHGVSPIVYSYINGTERFSFLPDLLSPAAAAFVKTRSDFRRRSVTSVSHLHEGDIFYFTCIDCAKKLDPIYKAFASKYSCFYAADIYSGAPWLEILPPRVSKATSALRLKKMLGCDEMICFGDGKNDIPMFMAADKCYAMANADNELKKVADGIIGSNENDGVARWLSENALG